MKGCLEHLNEDLLTGFSEMFERSVFGAFVSTSSLGALSVLEAETVIVPSTQPPPSQKKRTLSPLFYPLLHRINSPYFISILHNGPITREYATICNIHEAHLRPFFLILIGLKYFLLLLFEGLKIC